jgi:polyhydroxybutyrate depolymerase
VPVARELELRCAALALLAASGCRGAAARDAAAIARTVEESIEHEGWSRTYRLHVPPSRTERGPPLVVVLHGGGSSGEGMEEVTGFSAIADRERFAVVYPDGIGGPHGLGRAWNAGECCGRPHLFGVNDVSFIRRLIVDLSARLAVDRDRVFVVGYSNGAMLAHRIGSELSELVAGIAPYAASMRAQRPLEAPRFDLAPPRRAVAAVLVQGTDDPRAAYHGSEDSGGVDASFAHAGRFWAVAAGCRARATRRVDRRGSVWIDEYGGCPGAAPVTQVTLLGWQHEWPGPVNTGELAAGDPLRGFDLAELIWSVFATVERR